MVVINVVILIISTFKIFVGVLKNILQQIPESNNAVNFLKKLGKQFILVSNNTTVHIDDIFKELRLIGFNIEKTDIVTPIQAIVGYLKKQNLSGKKLYVISHAPLKDALIAEGFTLEENGPSVIKESIKELSAHGHLDDGSVGIVIADVDVNINYVKLQKAATFLKRPEVVFLGGAEDVIIPVGMKKTMLGPGLFVKILEQMTGKTVTTIAKPNPNLNTYIVEKYGIEDFSRVLFIGDSIPIDMGFAANCGYRKMLVLTGISDKSSIDNWTYPEEFKPDFYVDSLKTVHDLAVRIYEKLL